MATYTDNYQLTKPTMAETADIRTINGNMDTIDDILHASQISLADAYDSTQTYNTDDVVMYEFLMYKCLEDNVTGTWDATKWERTVASSSGASGTEVVPNPQGTPTADLNKIGIAGDIFNIAGSGGGNVYGAFIDTNRVIQATKTVAINTTDTYIATEDCIILGGLIVANGRASNMYVNGVAVGALYLGSGNTSAIQTIMVKKGDTFTFESGNSSSFYTVYGLTFGTNNIFTPQIYSLEEREVGVWIDNKPLYAKTFDKRTTTLSNQAWTNNILETRNTGISIKIMDGYAFLGNTIISYDFYRAFNSYFSWTIDNGDELSLRPNLDTSGQAIYAGIVTIWYTKDSDVAGSGSYNTLGVPTHHYSTEEQVIGTWIDGKPLYQKTVVLTSLPSNTSVTQQYPHNIDSIGEIVNHDVIATWQSGSTVKLPYAQLTNGQLNGIGSIDCNINKTNIEIRVGTDRSNMTAYATIQYTKITD